MTVDNGAAARLDLFKRAAEVLRDVPVDDLDSALSAIKMMAVVSRSPGELEPRLTLEDDFADILEGSDESPAQLVPGLVVEGQVNWFAGHPGHGKTTMAMNAALKVMEGGRHVVWLDWEGGKRPTARRLRAMGAPPTVLRERFHYAAAPALSSDAQSFARIAWALERWPGALVVFDSASKALSAAGLDENSPVDATRWTTQIVMPIREHGGTVIVIDHVAKGATKSTPYARGAGSKLADTEVFWYVEATAPFSREQVGELLLTKRKDREGVLPEQLRYRIGDGAGKLPVVRIKDEPGEAGGARDALEVAKLKVLDTLRRYDGDDLTQNQLCGLISGTRDKTIREAAATLAADRSQPVSVAPGARGSLIYKLDCSAVTEPATGLGVTL